jgi:hypothetical protein
MPGHPFVITAAGDEPAVSPAAIPRCNSSAAGPPAEEGWAIALNGLEALQQIARKGAAQKEKLRIQRSFPVAKPDSETEKSYAAPLAPLRTRDGQELSTFFERADMDSIEADILNLLSHLFPEPCWEDDLFEFLQDLLGHAPAPPSCSDDEALSRSRHGALSLSRVDVLLRP